MAGNLSVTIDTTRGPIVVELFPEVAPVTVSNFTNLINRGFYNGVKFHRVIPDFMVQTGDPEGTGFGGPGYNFADECTPQAGRTIMKHDRPGMLSMANAGPNTNGSQFFITHKDTDWLDGKHTVFGRVTSGQDVVDQIRQGDVMTTLTLEGDATALLAENAAHVEKWDAVLDKKFPRKG